MDLGCVEATAVGFAFRHVTAVFDWNFSLRQDEIDGVYKLED